MSEINTKTNELPSNQEIKTENFEDSPLNDEASEISDTSGPQFEEGRLLKMVRVRFPGNSRSFPFLIGKRPFIYGQKVVAMSDRGMAVGHVNSFVYELAYKKEMGYFRSISKIATDEDIINERDIYKKQKKAEETSKELIKKHELDMDLTHVELTQFGKKCVFYFTAPGRVDFRKLVKDLVGALKCRIELRQISVRDRSAALGGLGPCGRQTCCSSFLSKYGSVNIKMAKNQNLTLHPTKLNGVCGQLKCCIQYEDDVYKHKASLLPRDGEFIEAKNGDRGKVLRSQILEETFIMLTDQGKKNKYRGSQFDKKRKLPEDWKFPTQFETIHDETGKLIE